jgi:hypothetical protein
VFTVTETATNTPNGGSLNPVVYPNPVEGGNAKVAFTLNGAVASVTVKVVTSSYRVIYTNVVSTSISRSGSCTSGVAGFTVGQNYVCLNIADLNLANGLYYVVIALPDGTSATTELVVLH